MKLENQSGFSVVEILLVFTVLALALLPLAQIQSQSKREITEAERQSGAVRLAMNRLELARMAGFGNAVADTSATGPYRIVTQVVADPANPFLEEIQVTVSWDRGNEARQIVLAGKMANRR